MIRRNGTPPANDSYQTDDWIMKLFPVGAMHGMTAKWFDPCPLEEDWNLDGLMLDWKVHRRIFINPPYSNPLPWVQKAIATHQRYGPTIVMLLKHDSSTEWYRQLHEAGAHFLPIGASRGAGKVRNRSGRLKHRTGKGCSFPSVLVVLA